MTVSAAQKRASLKWDKENMVVLSCKVKKEQADKFKEYCAIHGKSSNTVIKEYVISCISTPAPGGNTGGESPVGNVRE